MPITMPQSEETDEASKPSIVYRTLTPEEGGYQAGCSIGEASIDDPTKMRRPYTDIDVT
jgi:hypothetical protein